MTIELYPFQRDAQNGLFTYWARKKGNPLLVAPTGSGKSMLLASICQQIRQEWSDTRLIIATHVKELIEQDFKAMLRLWPTAPAGIYSAGLGQRSISNPITFVGIQSVHDKAELFGFVDLLLIDEAHLLSRRADSMYGRFIAELRKVNPNLKVVGLTATPYRLDSGRLDKGEGAIFDGIAYEIGIGQLVDEGYLAPLVSKATELALNVDAVHKRGGEFIEAELQKAVDTASATAAAVREIVAYGATRRAWLCFCAGVEHAKHVALELQRSGIRAALVSGLMPTAERDRILADFKSGQLRAVCNANLLTTGFDHPPIDLIAMLRPTMSAGLYVQQLGRGMRTWPDKTDCLVLDFARNIARFGPVDMVKVKDPSSGTGPAPTKICPECASILFAGVRECPDCGYVFPVKDPDASLDETASKAPVMARDVQAEWVAVQGWRFERHEGRDGKPNSLRVEYRCGLSVHKEWVCFSHPQGSFPRRKADSFWLSHAGGMPLPGSVLDALKRSGELVPPAEIMVRRNGRYFEVASRRFVREGVAA